MRWLVAVLAALAVACGSAQERVIVAGGTTIVDSGLLDLLVQEYENTHPGTQLSVVGEATARVLALGRAGGAQVLVTHDPKAEAEFVAEGLAVRYQVAFASRFLLVGPPSVVDEYGGSSADSTFEALARDGVTFVSRGDASGTHVREIALWAAAGVSPFDQSWYLETGQGMGLTLQVADQREAVTLAELGAYRAAQRSIHLVPFSNLEWANPYHLTVVAGAPEEAIRFVDWLSSEQGRAALVVANLALFGEVVYGP